MPQGAGIYIYLAALLAVGVIALRRGGRTLIYSYLFFVPWFGLQANIGLTINIDRLIAAGLLGWVFIQSGPRAMRGFGLFFAYIALDTAAQSVTLPATVRDFTLLQGEWRWAFQIVMWGLLIGPAAVVAGARDESLARNALRAFAASAAVLSILAILQSLVYFTLHVDLFPIGMFDPAGAVRSAAFQADAFGGRSVFRAGALGGEPKHLAISLALAIGVISTELVYDDVLRWPRRVVLVVGALCSVALVATFSTQGIVLAVLNVLGVVASAPAIGRVKRLRVRPLFVSLAVIVALGIAIPGLSDVLEQRTVERLGETGGMEDSNIAVWDWLRDNPLYWPLGTGLGNVHLYAASYVPGEFLFYMGGRIFVAKSGLLRLLSEIGVVGLIAFLLTALAPVRLLIPHARKGRGLAGAVITLILMAIANFMLSADGPIYVFVVSGIGFAVWRSGVSDSLGTGAPLYSGAAK
jgi:hypothetical protein